MMENSEYKPFNGKTGTVGRVLEVLIIAGIVGAISVWGNAKVNEARVDNIFVSLNELKSTLNKFETTMEKIAIRTETNALTNEKQWGQINNLYDRLEQEKKNRQRMGN